MTAAPVPLQTPLHREHVAAGAAMTVFGGWQLPLRFGSELAEHRAVRERAGLFDLSHMAQLEVSGPGAGAALDHALVSRCSTLRPGRARYTMLVDADGGVLDDLIVYRLAEHSYLVVANAGNRITVLDELTGRSGPGTAVEDRTEHRVLLALQGPAAAGVLAPLTDVDLAALRPYAVAAGDVAGVPALVARTGYTGEDGFEISAPAHAAAGLWGALTLAGAEAGVVPCGLAARDTLRLEAGMPLYGHELSRAVTPYDAGLGRVVALDHDFVGRDALARRVEREGDRVLVGLRGEGRRAARAGSAVLVGDTPVGEVTSGALAPTLGHPVALAYVPPQHAAPGSTLDVDVRGHRLAMEVTALPFYRRPAPTAAPTKEEP